MSSLQLLDSFVKIDDTIQEREDFCGKCGYIAHCPIVSVDESQQYVHPARVDERPRHEWKERYLFLECLALEEEGPKIWLTPNDSEQSEYIFSASTENGPVTPRIVRG